MDRGGLALAPGTSVRLGRTLRDHLVGIRAFVEHRIGNAPKDDVHNQIRLISHRAMGVHSGAPLIATIHDCCGGMTLPQPQLLQKRR
ncbi:MAG: transposase [Planctomycetes bacterium]|nr:transposase [Planctomycetota bacterium]